VRPKSSHPAKNTKNEQPGHSKIIEQCVTYVQNLAAHDAGVRVDGTGNSEYAGKGRQIKKPTAQC